MKDIFMHLEQYFQKTFKLHFDLGSADCRVRERND